MCDDVEPNFDAMNDRVEPVMIDLTDVFTTGMLFDTRDELLKWARNVGRENGIVVVIFRSENATARPRTKTKLILGCERSGKYRPWKNPNLTRSTWTRKCDCPFRLRGTRSSVGDGWYLHVICGLHNHELAKKLTGHSFLGRLSQDEKNWLIPHKERFVEAWTNKVMQFGNTKTQRVESAHWSLKRILQDSIGDICSVWETINNMIVLQHNEIIASFEKSIIQKVHRYSNRLYANLRGVVSKNAIDHIAAEYDRVKYVGIDQTECRCTIRTTHGLPCACEIARYSMIPRSIPLDAIHGWWSKLTFHVDASSQPSELSMKHEIDVIVKKFEELDVPGKISLKGKLREIAYPSTTSMFPPVAKHYRYRKVEKLAPRPSVQKLTPRPSISKVQQPRVLPFKDWLSVEIHKFIDDIIDVGDDGNCGYRAVAALLGMGENCWAFIRQQCVIELQEFMSHYEILFGGENYVRQLIQNVYVEQVASKDNWMTLPEMGYVIASKIDI
ncbi:uncharacterized protein [Cicer arietinum]|uniref:uncharacterized protein n=1 Tax=Cicer arietinum TaxID=3827 RepID=UPI003CC69F32